MTAVAEHLGLLVTDPVESPKNGELLHFPAVQRGPRAQVIADRHQLSRQLPQIPPRHAVPHRPEAP